MGELDRMTMFEGGAGLSRRELVLRGGAAAGLFGLGGLLAACGGGAKAGSALKGSPAGAGKAIDKLTWAIAGDLVSLDYAFAYDFSTNAAVANITETLVRIGPDGRLVPNLATAWKQTGPTTWVYQIRKGVQFHDGTEMTAEDVAFSMNRIQDPKVGSYLATFNERVKSIAATGPYEVTVKLTKPDSLWEYSVATMAGAVSKKAFLQQHGKKVGSADVGIVGTGPYKYVSWTKGQQVVLERFDGYWDKSRAMKVKQVVIRVIEDEATTVAALGTGEIDGTFDITGRHAKELARFDSVALVEAPSYGTHYVGINTQRKPFDDPRVRQALSYAIDKQGILDSVWGGYGDVTKSPASPSMWSYEKPLFQAAYDKLPAFGQDLAKAKALVQEAGAVGARAKVLVATGFDEQMALALQSAASSIGIHITLEKVTAGEKSSREFAPKARDYDMTISQWGSDIPDPAGNLTVTFSWVNKVTDNSAYDNPKVNGLLEAARESADAHERATLLTQAQAQIVEDQPWVVFYSPKTLMALNKRVGGYQLRPLYYWDAWAADISGTA